MNTNTMVVEDIGAGPFSIANDINQSGVIVGDKGQPYDCVPFRWQDGVVHQLPTLGFGGVNSAQGINDQGWVAGWVVAEGHRAHACIWQDDQMLDLGLLGGTASRAFGINNRGQVVGRIAVGSPDSETFSAFLWEPGHLIDLASLGHQLGCASAISKREPVVGRSNITGALQRAFLWEGGSTVDLGTLGGQSTNPFGVGDLGQIAGRIAIGPSASGGIRAFVWVPDKLITLPTLGGQSSMAVAINNKGQVVGGSETADGDLHAVLWEAGNTVDLGTLGGRTSMAWGINDLGQIVGGSRSRSVVPWRFGQSSRPQAFLWEKAGPRRARPPLQDEHTDNDMTGLGMLPGQTSSNAIGINNHGQIVGVSPCTEDSVMRALLWQGGEMTALGGSYTKANAINDLGQVVGQSSGRAARWRNKTLQLESDSITWGLFKTVMAEQG